MVSHKVDIQFGKEAVGKIGKAGHLLSFFKDASPENKKADHLVDENLRLIEIGEEVAFVEAAAQLLQVLDEEISIIIHLHKEKTAKQVRVTKAEQEIDVPGLVFIQKRRGGELR